jgi:hypothetical protein
MKQAQKQADARMAVQLTVTELRAMIAEAVTEALDARETKPAVLLNQNQLAELLGTSERTIFSLRQAGMPSVLLGDSPRFEPEAVLAWMRQSTRDRTIADMQSVWRAILDHE